MSSGQANLFDVQPIGEPVDVLQEMRPISEIYAGHPVLSRDVTVTMLENCPIEKLQELCRRLHTNVEGLMELLERRGMI